MKRIATCIFASSFFLVAAACGGSPAAETSTTTEAHRNDANGGEMDRTATDTRTVQQNGDVDHHHETNYDQTTPAPQQ